MSSTIQHVNEPAAAQTANAGPSPGDSPLDRTINAMPLPQYETGQNCSAAADEITPEGVRALVERITAAEALVAQQAAADLVLHRKLASETLRADQGWARYEAANSSKNAHEAARATLIAKADGGRAAGRAEALAILLGLCPETGIDNYIGWSSPVAPEDEGCAHWNEAKLRELFHVDSQLADMFDKAELQYYKYQAEHDEAIRAKAFAENMRHSARVRKILAAAGEHDLIGELCQPSSKEAILAAFEAHYRADCGMPADAAFNWSAPYMVAALDGWQAHAAGPATAPAVAEAPTVCTKCDDGMVWVDGCTTPCLACQDVSDDSAVVEVREADELDHGDTVLRVQAALGCTDSGWISPDVILLRIEQLKASIDPWRNVPEWAQPGRAALRSIATPDDSSLPADMAQACGWIEQLRRRVDVLLDAINSPAAKSDDWNPDGYPDSKERCRKMLLSHMKNLGLSDGQRGWLEHGDESGKTVRDSLSFEGELLFAFETIGEALRAAPSQIDSQDADRWRTALQFVGADRSPALGNSYFVLRGISAIPGTDLMRGGVAGHFTAAIDQVAKPAGQVAS